MKLKYYLRGMGIGIVLTAVIMGIVLGGSSNKMSDAEVIRRAKQLGMVEAENTLSEYSGTARSKDETGESDETASGETLAEEGKEVSEEVDKDESETGESVPEVDETQEESSAYGESSESVEAEADIALAGKNSAENASTETVRVEEADTEERNNTENYSDSREGQSDSQSGTQLEAETSSVTATETVADTAAGETAANEISADEIATVETTASEQEVAATDEKPSDVNYIVVVLPGGSDSNTCARVLRESGVVVDGADFNRYLVNSGLDRKVRSGTKQIPKGASYEEIASIITR